MICASNVPLDDIIVILIEETTLLYSITMVLCVFIYFTCSSFIFFPRRHVIFMRWEILPLRENVLHDTLNRDGTLICKEHVSSVNVI